VKEKGEEVNDGGLRDPAPSSVKVTLEALPPKTLPLTVIEDVPQVLPSELESVTVGGFTHPQLTVKLEPVVIHPLELRTVIL
jgi:hypothetical protein